VIAVDMHDRSAYGKHIVIMAQTSKGPVFTMYAHLSEVDVQIGEEIKIGQLIGQVGTTGKSSAPHLHLETRPEYSFGKGKEVKYLSSSELNKILSPRET
jgi:murein DD-endopeptidase MepM/ murein hydrolase activator NlpD